MNFHSQSDFIFAANWKMYKTPDEAEQFFNAFFEEYKPGAEHLIFLPPATDLYVCQKKILHQKNIFFGGQNSYFEVKGAFTGEISPLFLKQMGAKYGLVGHSERRQIFGEKNELLAKKVKALQDNGLIPIFCIGETIEERKSNKTNEVLTEQIQKGLALLNPKLDLIVAYEPVWAIGTGLTANLEQVSEAHLTIRGLLDKMGTSAPILYGGSVKPDNSGDLKKVKNVNGFLIGGASLEVDSFISIIKS